MKPETYLLILYSLACGGCVGLTHELVGELYTWPAWIFLLSIFTITYRSYKKLEKEYDQSESSSDSKPE